MEANQETINQTYSRMEQDGWDTKSPLKWGFFFISKEENHLKGIYSELADHHYEVEDVHQDEDADWVLQVSKVEALAADKLYRRCLAFNELAEAYQAYFDGWDVGKAAA